MDAAFFLMGLTVMVASAFVFSAVAGWFMLGAAFVLLGAALSRL